MNSGLISEYIEAKRQLYPYPVPVKFHPAYIAMLDALTEHPACLGFKKSKLTAPILNAATLTSLAVQLYQVSPAHYYKSLHTLIHADEQNQLRLILARPRLTIIDVGCGSGVTSNALLSLIGDFQDYTSATKNHLSQVDVQFIGIDPNNFAGEIYPQLLEHHVAYLGDVLIETKKHFVADPFNKSAIQNTIEILGQHQHIAIIAMSNVIKPFWEAWFSSFFPRIAGFGVEQAQLLVELLERSPIDRLVVLNIGTQDKQDSTKWGYQLKLLAEAFFRQLLGIEHIFEASPVTSVHIDYENFPSSFYGQKKLHGDSDYYSNITVVTHRNYYHDQAWHQTLEPSNLQLAWARARYYLNYESISDQVEIALFDKVLSDKLKRLQSWWESYDWRRFHIQHALHFEQPKAPPDVLRPKMLCRFEEQIASTALIQHNGFQASEEQRSSYSFRLNPVSNGTEYLYYYWLDQYKAYVDEARKAAELREDAVVIRTDISSFYTKINQEKLLKIVLEKLGVKSSRLRRSLEVVIERDCGTSHEDGCGLPQGHVAAGFFANIYLDSIDAEFTSFFSPVGKTLGVSYYRFADDMLLIIPRWLGEARVLRRLDRILAKLNLDRSLPKTDKFSTSQDFIDTIKWDDLLEELGKQYRNLTTVLYTLPAEYQKLCEDDRWEFMRHYQQCLQQIGIYVSLSWLSRKIHQYTFCGASRNAPNQVTFPTQVHLEAERWAEEFRTLNPHWTTARLQLSNKLEKLFWDTQSLIRDTENEAKDFKSLSRRLRFSIHRLSMLGFSQRTAQVCYILLVEQPSLLSPRLVTEALAKQGFGMMLPSVYQDATSSYVRACLLRSIGFMEELELLPLLWSALYNPESKAMEALLASEALLLADKWQDGDTKRALEIVAQEDDPYLLKNYLLILCRARKHEHIDTTEQLLQFQRNRSESIVVDAIQYAISQDCRYIFWPPEPPELIDYYSCYYPDTEGEQEHGQYYGGLFHS